MTSRSRNKGGYLLRAEGRYPITKGMGQRAIADLIEMDIVDRIVEQGGVRPKSVRTIEDVSYDNILIDIKTRDINREFSMPNMISIDRLRKNSDTTIQYIFVDYRVNSFAAEIVDLYIRDIHTIPWECLSIQNLGLGQLQLSNYDKNKFFRGTKEEWFDTLRLKSVEFYNKQISKFERKIKELL